MPHPSRFRWSLAAALLAHAALTWELRVRPALHATDPSSIATATQSDIEIEPPSMEVPVAAVEPSSVARRPVEVTRERTESRSAVVEASVEPPASGVAEVPGAPPDTSRDGSWTFSPTGATSGGGALSAEGFATVSRAGVRETVAEAEKKAAAADARPRKTFSDHDLSLGLVPGGQFVTITRDSVRRSLVPDISRAVLEFDTNPAGIVVSVRVLDVSSDRTGWDEVAAALATEVATGRPEKVPSGANGISVVLEVVSTLKTGSGSTPTSGVAAILHGINNPADLLLGAGEPTRRVVAARIVDVRAL